MHSNRSLGLGFGRSVAAMPCLRGWMHSSELRLQPLSTAHRRLDPIAARADSSTIGAATQLVQTGCFLSDPVVAVQLAAVDVAFEPAGRISSLRPHYELAAALVPAADGSAGALVVALAAPPLLASAPLGAFTADTTRSRFSSSSRLSDAEREAVRRATPVQREGRRCMLNAHCSVQRCAERPHCPTGSVSGTPRLCDAASPSSCCSQSAPRRRPARSSRRPVNEKEARRKSSRRSLVRALDRCIVRSPHPLSTPPALRTVAPRSFHTMASPAASSNQPDVSDATSAAEDEAGVAAVGTGVAASSSKASKNHRKKANRKAKVRAATAVASALLGEVGSLTHRTVMGQWFPAFHKFKGSFRTYYVASADLSEHCLEWAFLLTKINMQRMYQNTQGWGWNDKGQRTSERAARAKMQQHNARQSIAMQSLNSSLRWFSVCSAPSSEKRAECRHPDTRYFIVTQVEQPDPATAAAAAGSSSSAAAPAAAAAGSASSAASVDPACSSSSPPSSASADEIEFEGTPVAFCAVRFTTGDQDQAPLAYM